MAPTQGRIWLAVVALLASALAGRAPVAAQSPAAPPEVASLLSEAGFMPDDLAALDAGRVVVRTETAPERLEASVAAAARITTTGDRALAYFRQLVSYVDGQVTTGYGTFSDPPAIGDINRLTLDPSDLAALRSCDPNDCAIRVGAANAPDLDWTSAEANARATQWVRQALVEYASAYLRRGNAALRLAIDRDGSRDLPDEWRDLVGRSQLVSKTWPELGQHLLNFPASHLAGAVDEMYWDQQHYTGLKPILGVTHLVTWRNVDHPERVVAVQKQIYASHYLYASLAVTVIAQMPSTQPPTTYVFYVNRSRGDLLRTPTTEPATRSGLAGRLNGLSARVENLSAGLQRRLGEQLIRQSAERLLGAMKDALER